jgi:hypothetical protein
MLFIYSGVSSSQLFEQQSRDICVSKLEGYIGFGEYVKSIFDIE